MLDYLKQNKGDLVFFAPFSVMILFAIPRLFSFFAFPFYPTLDRHTMYGVFSHPVTPSLQYDQIIIVFAGLGAAFFLVRQKKFIPILALFAALGVGTMFYLPAGLDVFSLLIMPAMTVLFIMDYKKKRITKTQKDGKNLLYVITLILCGFEIFVLLSWVAFGIAPSTIKKSFLWHPMSLEFELFYVLSNLSSFTIILCTYAFLLRPIKNMMNKPHVMIQDDKTHSVIHGNIEKINSKILQIKHISRHGLLNRLFAKSYVEVLEESLDAQKTRLETPSFRPNVIFAPRVVLAIAISLSVVFAVYPYLPTINPQYTWISVDDFNYQQFLRQFEKNSLQDVIRKSFVISSGDRPITLLLMESFHRFLGTDIMTSVRFFSVPLGPGIVLAVYFFVKEGLHSRQNAAYAALFTAFSHQIVVGMYAGFFANWLGLVLVYLSFMMMHKFWIKPSVKNYLLVVLHSILSLLTYIYVDVYLLATILVFLIISALKFGRVPSERKKILIISSIFAIYAALFALRVFVTSPDLFDAIFGREDISFSFIEFKNRWTNFPYFFHVYMGGFFANFAVLALAFLWTMTAKYEKPFDRILISALFVGAIPLVAGNEVLQSRVFYDMPVQIAAAIAVLRLVNRNDIKPFFAKTAFILISVHFAIYAIRSLSNLNPFGF